MMASYDQILLEKAYAHVLYGEALDNPYLYSYDQAEGSLVFYPNPKDTSKYYTVNMLRYDETPDDFNERGYTLEILFDYNDENSKKYGVTTMTNANTGEQFRIMATIKKIVLEYLNNKRNLNKIDLITFTSKNFEKGKTRLYTKLGQMLAQQLGPKWKFFSAPGHGEDAGAIRFTIERISR